MKFELDISDEEIFDILRQCISDLVKSWVLDSVAYKTEFRRKFEKWFKESVKEMLYEPEVKNKIIEDAIESAAVEFRKKGLQKFINSVME